MEMEFLLHNFNNIKKIIIKIILKKKKIINKKN